MACALSKVHCIRALCSAKLLCCASPAQPVRPASWLGADGAEQLLLWRQCTSLEFQERQAQGGASGSACDSVRCHTASATTYAAGISMAALCAQLASIRQDVMMSGAAIRSARFEPKLGLRSRSVW